MYGVDHFVIVDFFEGDVNGRNGGEKKDNADKWHQFGQWVSHRIVIRYPIFFRSDAL